MSLKTNFVPCPFKIIPGHPEVSDDLSEEIGADQTMESEYLGEFETAVEQEAF